MTSEGDLKFVLSILEERIKTRFRELKRKDRTLSQWTIADRAEVDRKQFNKILNGNAEPRITTLIKIAGALDIPLKELLGDIKWVPGEDGKFGQMEQEHRGDT